MSEITDYGILIVDDEEPFLNTMRRILKRKNFSETVTALNARQGIRILESTEIPFALIISDQNMPEMSGSEFFKKTLEISPLSRRILLTGDIDFLSVIDAINHGAIHKYIMKTSGTRELIAAILSELKVYDKYAHKKEFINLTKTQNRHFYRLAKQLKHKNKKFLHEIKLKQKEKQDLENALEKIKKEKKKKQDFPGLNAVLLRNIILRPATLLKAFNLIKQQADSCFTELAENIGIRFSSEPGIQALNRDGKKQIFDNDTVPGTVLKNELQGDREIEQTTDNKNKIRQKKHTDRKDKDKQNDEYNQDDYEIIDMIIQYAVRKAEPALRRITLSSDRKYEKKFKIDDYKTVPDTGELAYHEGYITGEELERIKTELNETKENAASVSIGKYLLSSGLINRVKFSRLMVKKRLIETRIKDREFAEELIKRKAVSKETIEQAFTEQLNLFEQDSTCLTLGDILVRENAITPELRDELFRSHNRIGEISDSANISALLSSSKKSSLIELQVSPDKTKAYIRLPRSLHGSSDIKPVKDLLHMRGIRFGIVEDKLILGFMKYAADPEKKFTIAIGRYPEPGENAYIKYYFNTKYQRPGIVSEDGTIDFRDRGDIPFVEKGTLLAEKIPLKKGKPGLDIFGEPIPIDDVKDCTLKGGTGTKSDETGLKLYASTEGQPALNTAGVVSVLKELNIKGNVDFETGHINFQGNVFVKGIIKEGFHVNCVDLTAGEIHGGTIKLSGNLNVSTGIINAQVRTNGNVKAKFINNSKIDAFGDIIVTREIMESDIAVSGECINENGRITSSVIAAKKGFTLGQVGTIKTSPSTIKAGLNDYMQRLEAVFSVEIEKQEATINMFKQKKKQLENKNFEMHKNVADHSFIQETLMKKITSLKQQLLSAKSDKSEMIRIAGEIKNMENTINESDDIIRKIFDDQDIIMQDIAKYDEKIKTRADELEMLKLEKKAMEEIDEFDEPVPVVRVKRKILAGTKIMGPKSFMVVKHNLGACKIMEIDSSDPDDRDGRQMVIQNL